jgi:hypothetical protein
VDQQFIFQIGIVDVIDSPFSFDLNDLFSEPSNFILFINIQIQWLMVIAEFYQHRFGHMLGGRGNRQLVSFKLYLFNKNHFLEHKLFLEIDKYSSHQNSGLLP